MSMAAEKLRALDADRPITKRRAFGGAADDTDVQGHEGSSSQRSLKSWRRAEQSAMGGSGKLPTGISSPLGERKGPVASKREGEGSRSELCVPAGTRLAADSPSPSSSPRGARRFAATATPYSLSCAA